MFRFWSSDSRGSERSDQLTEAHHSPIDLTQPQQPQTSLQELQQRPAVAPVDFSSTISSLSEVTSKRRRPSFDDSDDNLNMEEPAKRARTRDSACEVDSRSATPEMDIDICSPPSTLERARDVISHQIGLEVLLKHDELRLINQELAKCQVALEQLRRCHLIPYPTACPTPEQMLDISSGKGPALRSQHGEKVPQWAPPFGVADGPYARHYAKWLIPDPAFDGVEPEWQFTPEATRARHSFAEGRTTRNSFTEPGPASKGRPSRANAGAKLQALSQGYPQPKEKAGPCVLKRSDGKTVKLVCIDCHRDNFSSTQGFINHCRIAHKRDFKSHDEAAMQSGQPIDQESAVAVTQKNIPEKLPGSATGAPVTSSVIPAAVHPFARSDMSDQQACAALRSRIASSLELYNRGKLPGVTAIPVSKPLSGKPVVSGATADVPHLSRLLQSRKFNGSLGQLVRDAKTKISYEDITPDEDSDDADMSTNESSNERAPVVMRVPAKSVKSPAPSGPAKRPTSSKSRAHMTFVPPPQLPPNALKTSPKPPMSQDDIDMEANLSPNTLVSNIAPSLVSDDGEYDESDDASSVSGDSAVLDEDSETDVAEITLDDDHDHRNIGRGSGAVRLRKDDAKHVTFMSPVQTAAQARRKPKA
jgi:ADA HAT complex component 1